MADENTLWASQPKSPDQPIEVRKGRSGTVRVGTLRPGSRIVAADGPFALAIDPDGQALCISPSGILPFSMSPVEGFLGACYKLHRHGFAVVSRGHDPTVYDVTGIGHALTPDQIVDRARSLPNDR